VPLHRQHCYDLILLDLQMPGLNGFQVMKGLKEIEQGGYLPVLALTAQPSFKIAALEAGARDFISKPFDLLEVHKRIHNMLEVRLLYRELAQYSRQQQELALHDPLTGLPNRRLLEDRIATVLQHATRQQHRAAVMYLDLDGFKAINDTHGHAYGDEILSRWRSAWSAARARKIPWRGSAATSSSSSWAASPPWPTPRSRATS
jgi:PleD family two-component response regulator